MCCARIITTEVESVVPYAINCFIFTHFPPLVNPLTIHKTKCKDAIYSGHTVYTVEPKALFGAMQVEFADSCNNYNYASFTTSLFPPRKMSVTC